VEKRENPSIRPIVELLGENFFVPRYQRGYRWGKQEITELLDDILQYYLSTIDKKKSTGDFYCLQPIVVKEKIWNTEANEAITGWELIDGQQRLITLFIILSFLEDIRQFHDCKNELFFIDFETRENCRKFFKDKEFVSKINDTNIDFSYISNGYEYVKQWFNKNSTNRLYILQTILNTIYNVSIIWYEAKDLDSSLTSEDNSIDLFTRLNEGKIPLTDAELIKALLLQGDRYPKSEEKYVNENSYQPSSKIEFIFKLLAEEWNCKGEFVYHSSGKEELKHFEYIVFDKYLKKKRDDYTKNVNLNQDILDPINGIWEEVKEKFSFLLEWYEDHKLYHYIGYLIAVDGNNKDKLIRELLEMDATKIEFIESLKKKIAVSLNFKKKKENSTDYKTLADFSYGEDNAEIIKILLLLNIDSLIKHSKEVARFPFHLYKKENITSIEHIHPQNPENIAIDEKRSRVWLKSHINKLYVLITKETNMENEINNYIKTMEALIEKYNENGFKEIYRKVINLYTQISGIMEKEVHTLYNLALVDKDTNSALNNSFFDVKREIIKKNAQVRYIPICTQRVFSKYYSSSPQEMIFWSDEDRKAYFAAIEDVYNSFVGLLEAKNGNNR